MSAKTLAQEMAEGGGPQEKRLTWLSSTSGEDTEGSCNTYCSSVAGKGPCVMYTTDGMRFEVPLVLLGTMVFAELLRMSQEEFGFAGTDGGRITLPCDSLVMELETAFLSSMGMPCHYHVESHLGVSQHFRVCTS